MIPNMRRLLALGFLLATASCATVSHGRLESISLESTPSAANVELRCHQVTRSATTPATVEIARNATDCAATFSKTGFKTKSVSIERGVHPAYWLNFLGLAALPLGISDNSPLSISGDTGLALVLAGIGGLSVDASDGVWRNIAPSKASTLHPPMPANTSARPASPLMLNGELSEMPNGSAARPRKFSQ